MSAAPGSASLARDHRRAPPLVITQGDPAGIGPEIVLKAMQQRPDLLPRVLVAGDLPTLRRAAGCLAQGLPPVMLAEVGGLRGAVRCAAGLSGGGAGLRTTAIGGGGSSQPGGWACCCRCDSLGGGGGTGRTLRGARDRADSQGSLGSRWRALPWAHRNAAGAGSQAPGHSGGADAGAHDAQLPGSANRAGEHSRLAARRHCLCE